MELPLRSFNVIRTETREFWSSSFTLPLILASILIRGVEVIAVEIVADVKRKSKWVGFFNYVVTMNKIGRCKSIYHQAQ